MPGSAARGPSGRPDVVTVLAVSDEVDDALLADTRGVSGAELILACGDLPFEYLDSLMNALDVPLVFVPGNHDPDLSGSRSSRSGLTLRAGLPARAPWPDGAVNADGRVVDAAGLRVAGLGGCRRYNAGPRPRGGREVDVVLTHAPPRGVGDGDDPPHRGFTALHGLVAALRPAGLLHGHVHPYGTPARPATLGRTVVCNVTGWHLLEIRPGGDLAELLPATRAPGTRTPGTRAQGARTPGTRAQGARTPGTRAQGRLDAR
jgi:hypothetical protein